MALIKILTDDSPMPFGRHRGKKMKDVPPGWLLWYNDQPAHNIPGKAVIGSNTCTGALAESIRANDRAVREYIAGVMDRLLAEQKQARQDKRNYMFNPLK